MEINASSDTSPLKRKETQCSFSSFLSCGKNICRQVLDYSHSTVVCVKITSLTLFLLYVGIPVFVKANQWILPKVVFCTLLRWPPFINLSHPSDFNLNHTRNFYLHIEDGVDVGAWQVLPKSRESENLRWDQYENTLNDGKIVFLYLHGNSGTRGSHHRVQLYRLLSRMDFHLLTFDYRGYGDSTGEPTEDGVVADAYFVYKWLKERVGDSKIFIWGHSLGTGVTTKLGKKLSEEGNQPAGIILESPFNNIRHAAFHHPFAMPYRMLPWFDWIFVDGLGEHGVHFKSDVNIMSVTPHILILHAKDDFVVPFHLGEKLFKDAKAARDPSIGDIEFVAFEGSLGYGHKLIYKAPKLPDLISKFVEKCT